MPALRAEGSTAVRGTPAAVRDAILDPAVLARIIPGAERVTRGADGTFTALLGLGVGRFRGRQTVILRVDSESGGTLAVSGQATGPFGRGEATGHIQLHKLRGGTLIEWRYDGQVEGPVTRVGPLLLRLSATAFTTRVFARLRAAMGLARR